MKLTKDQVKYVARLANLSLTDSEEEIYLQQISSILEYIEKLNLVDTQKVKPTYNVSGNLNVYRLDEREPGLTQQQVLENSSDAKKGFFVTKGVFKEE